MQFITADKNGNGYVEFLKAFKFIHHYDNWI